jgi:hypothetical protein
VERLLCDVVADGFVLYCCGPRAAPCALVASYQWEDYLDLLTIRRFDRIITVRALLNLLPPTHPQAPTSVYPAPAALHIPRAEQRPMSIQLPPPRRTDHRAARLTATIAGRR